MATSRAVRVPRGEAEATRQRLIQMDVLRIDLEVAKDGGDILFPVVDSCGPRLPTEPWEFMARENRPQSYQAMLPPDIRDAAPRAFDTIGDIVIVKVPGDLGPQAARIGDALLRFNAARAVFHDAGVKGEFRTRELSLIAGTGGSLTQVSENGTKLWVDPAVAYFSPRLASERARVAALVVPGETAVDLFGGVAPFGIQLAKRGAVVHSVDLNPHATGLALKNVEGNGVAGQVHLHTGDARAVAKMLPKADRIIMNLPHGAKDFLDVAAAVAKPRATIHYHEILAPEEVATRSASIVHALKGFGRTASVNLTRIVRNYSPQEAHVAFDIKVE